MCNRLESQEFESSKNNFSGGGSNPQPPNLFKSKEQSGFRLLQKKNISPV